MYDPCKRATLSVALVLLTLPVLAQQKPAEMPPMPVKTAAVSRETLNIEVTAVGTLRADETVMIRPEIAGRVVTLHFKEGQAVSEGDPLVTLDQGEYQAQLAGSTAQVGLEEISYRRLQDLQRKNLSSPQILDETKARLDAARATQTLTQVRLDKTVIRAPFAGTVGLRLVSPGAYVKAGDDIANLESLGAMKLDFRVPETYLARLATGQILTVRVDAWPDQGFEGTTYAIDPAVDPETRTVLLRARLPNKGNKLRPGLFARVNLVLERRENALIAPEQAIVPLGQTPFVYRVVEGKAVMTPVKLGLRRPGKVEILEGLKAGDQVVTDGQLKIRDGAAVTVLPPPGTSPPTVPQR
ncbi:efflux RND transporter periplasmic adaptor subunit [Candidatus Contendibacter odensensis]|uniref:HlyD-like secretion protein n=1 Tax=Candidatus Contendobacter odensis Run_B_J11 TaxID=1400861 RepID=A0A7U7GE89_9GAMM|nr:efflux RND transporter periplasmic adaptor subunit [Candidatus Contendobacter odensis]CDH46722.1 putative HlyD-like secretion protein [Candidatus Contendobacter odensis Run_B_J11]